MANMQNIQNTKSRTQSVVRSSVLDMNTKLFEKAQNGSLKDDAERVFDEIDKDKSGTIDRDEFAKLYSVISLQIKQNIEAEATASTNRRRQKILIILVVLLFSFLILSIGGNCLAQWAVLRLTRELGVATSSEVHLQSSDIDDSARRLEQLPGQPSVRLPSEDVHTYKERARNERLFSDKEGQLVKVGEPPVRPMPLAPEDEAGANDPRTSNALTDTRYLDVKLPSFLTNDFVSPGSGRALTTAPTPSGITKMRLPVTSATRTTCAKVTESGPCADPKAMATIEYSTPQGVVLAVFDQSNEPTVAFKGAKGALKQALGRAMAVNTATNDVQVDAQRENWQADAVDTGRQLLEVVRNHRIMQTNQDHAALMRRLSTMQVTWAHGNELTPEGGFTPEELDVDVVPECLSHDLGKCHVLSLGTML